MMIMTGSVGFIIRPCRNPEVDMEGWQRIVSDVAIPQKDSDMAQGKLAYDSYVCCATLNG